MRLAFILSGRRVRPPGFAIQDSIRQTKSLFDQPGFGVSGSHPGDSVDLVERKVTGTKPFGEFGEIGKTSRH